MICGGILAREIGDVPRFLLGGTRIGKARSDA
jgi:hypothetical protein